MKLDEIDFRNFAAEEIIDLLLKEQNPKYEPLILWLKRGVEYQKVNHYIRLTIANSERDVDALLRRQL